MMEKPEEDIGIIVISQIRKMFKALIGRIKKEE